MKDIHSSLNPHWMSRVRDNQRIERLVHPHLPEAMRGHIQVIGFEQGKLTLGCDSPAWTARLRFMETELKRQLCAAGVECRSLRTRVLAATAGTAERTSRPGPELKRESSKALNHLAEHCVDEKLGAALRRLASRSSD